MTWMRKRRRHDDTMTPVTPTTHFEPLLNDVDPSDPTVQALTAGSEEKPLPEIPRERLR